MTTMTTLVILLSLLFKILEGYSSYNWIYGLPVLNPTQSTIRVNHKNNLFSILETSNIKNYKQYKYNCHCGDVECTF